MSAPTQSEEPVVATPVESTTPAVVLEGEALKQAVLRQVEFYFSAQNLPADAYLLSNMDESYFVPLALIATFGKIKSLTTDVSFIAESLVNSNIVELSPDKQKIKPKETTKQRTRLILHTLPAGTTDEDVQNVFTSGNYNPTIQSDVNNCWFATFETEEQATAALGYIRTQKIKGESIRARLKPEPLLRNLYIPNELPKVPMVYGTPNYYPYRGWGPWDLQDPQNPQFQRNPNDKDPRNNRPYNRKPRGPKDFKKGPYDPKKPRQNNRNNKNNKSGRENYKKSHNTTLPLGPAHFPPLPSSKKDSKSGYVEPFTKYTQEQLVTIIQSLHVVPPENLPSFPSDSPILSAPNTVLESSKPAPIEDEDDLQVMAQPTPEAQKPKNTKKPKNEQEKRGNKKGQKEVAKPTYSQVVNSPPVPTKSENEETPKQTETPVASESPAEATSNSDENKTETPAVASETPAAASTSE